MPGERRAGSPLSRELVDAGLIELIELPDDSLVSAAGRLRLFYVIGCGGRSDGQVGVHNSLPT
jgi:hypothetical protein